MFLDYFLFFICQDNAIKSQHCEYKNKKKKSYNFENVY
ncbi:hypothetical protein CUZ97_1206 [Enterococcus faecium]|nr:hypothetical protein [Enterococcus faecium]